MRLVETLTLGAGPTTDLEASALFTSLDGDQKYQVWLAINNAAGANPVYLVPSDSSDTTSGVVVPAGEKDLFGFFDLPEGIPDAYQTAGGAIITAIVQFPGV
jgi:hypothetical protein